MEEKILDFLAYRQQKYRNNHDHFEGALMDVMQDRIDSMHRLKVLTDMEYFVLTLTSRGMSNKKVLFFVNNFLSDKATLGSIRVVKHNARCKYKNTYNQALYQWDM